MLARTYRGDVQRLRFAVGLVSFVIVSMLGGLVLSASVLPLVTGWERVVLTSGSMQPAIDPGDVVLTSTAVHPLDPGTVIVFENPNKPGSLITHRIIENLPDGSYRTKGDANAQADVSPVAQDTVVGRGVTLVPAVGLPVIWARQGHPALAGAVAVLVLLLVWLSRYGLLSKYDPWLCHERAKPVENPKPRTAPSAEVTPAAGAATVVMLVIAAGIWAQPHPASGAFAASTVNSGNRITMAAAAPIYYLKTNSSGPTDPTYSLPLAVTAPTLTTLYDYDTTRGGKGSNSPGLEIQKGLGLDETNAANIQRWTTAGPVTLGGNVRVTLWSAMKDFKAARGSVIVGLYDCNGDTGTSSCTLIKSQPATQPMAGGSGNFEAMQFDFGTISHQATRLQLRIVLGSTAEGPMWFAYDTTSYPAKITYGN